MNFARLNHILIPSTLEGREKLRKKRWVRLLRPMGWFYGALSDEGRVLSLLILFVGTAALEVSRTQVYILWAVLFGLMAASMALRRAYTLTGVTLEAHSPERMHVGAEMTFQLSMRNAHDVDHHAIRVRGPFLPWDGTWKGEPPRTTELPAGSAWTSQIRARFIERGPHHIEPFTACAVVPFGIAVGPSIASRGCRFTVVPRLAPVTALQVGVGESQHRGGSRQALRRGEAMELRGVRPYRRGDPLRDLHPKTWARSGAPHVREYQEESFTRIGIIVDTDSEGSSENGFEAVLSLCAGIVSRLTASDAVLEALVIGEHITPMSKGSARATLDQALDLLAHAKTSTGPAAGRLVDELGPMLATMSAVIVVTQSTDPSRLELIEMLHVERVAARLIRVHDDTGPAWLARRRTQTPPRAEHEQVVLATRINGEEPITL